MLPATEASRGRRTSLICSPFLGGWGVLAASAAARVDKLNKLLKKY